MKRKVYFPNIRTGIGGPTSFQKRIIKVFKNNDIKIMSRGEKIENGSVLVISSTKHIFWLLKCKLKGLKIVQRLDGILWRHKIEEQTLLLKIRHYLINWLMFFIRNYLADSVIYQSNFIKNWWYNEYGKSPCSETVIFNGVDLNKFSIKEGLRAKKTMLCVEGTLQSDIVTLDLLLRVHDNLYKKKFIKETIICGRIENHIKKKLSLNKGINYVGLVEQDEMHNIYKKSDFYLSLEINPPCPNSVIEALASGLPVIGYDTGSLGEIIDPGGGMLLSYNGNPFNLENPDISMLDKELNKFIKNFNKYAYNSRKLAEEKFNICDTAERYAEVLFT
tara:strand:- start:37 stop:1035 length:999 start_codon:yes stop_codon:yes gene_type:complete